MMSKDVLQWRCLFLLLLLSGLGAKHVTPNFEVDAPTDAIAEKVAVTAEHYRKELAIEWLGETLPNWSKRCLVRVKVGQVGAGGATTFSFGGGHVYGWDMTVQGSLERILDSVIPHEVSHTIFACHFRRPLPRWADEGAATLAEEDSEQRRQQKLAEEVLPTTRRIPLRELLQITEYPKNMQHVLTLYAEGYSLADYLVQKGGKPRFLKFVQDAHESGWDAAFRKHYAETNVESVEQKWSRWVIAGSPSLRQADDTLLASATSTAARDTTTVENAASIVRSQSPDPQPRVKSASESARKKANPKDQKSVATIASGHTLAPRAETVTAPEPRRRNLASGPSKTPSNEDLVESDPPSPFAPQTEIAVRDSSSEAMNSLASTPDRSGKLSADEQRRPRAPYLSRPELRRPANSRSSQDNDDESRLETPYPSPFAPVVSAASDRPIAARDRWVTTELAPTSLRQASRSLETRGGAVERSSQVGTPVKPVFDRESTLRFKSFSSK